MRKLNVIFACLLFSITTAVAQDAVSYQTPPKVIADLLLAKPTPNISLNSKAEWMLLSERNSYPTVEELGQPEFKVAGLRLNPNNFSLSRQNFLNNFILKRIKEGKEYKVSGLPANLLAGNVSWSPSETKIAFTNTTNTQVDLYVIDVATQKATKINKHGVNTVLGNAYLWVDDQTIVYKSTLQAATNAPKRPITPKGPTVQQSLGKTAPSPTFQDLIKSPYDEQIFEFYATAQLIQNKNGVETMVGKPAILSSFSLSPDKKYMMQRQIQKP
ncbi:MAG: peptidase S9 prolyl oligopeptidase active site domain-containing, partial [Chitinophagaceae bacterium]